MNIRFFYETYERPITLALGFFDCIHSGHAALISETVKSADKHDCESAVLTFANDPNPVLGKKSQIYSSDQRAFALKNLGVENMIYTFFNERFAALSAEDFLSQLTRFFNIKGVVSGKDYLFGKNAEGNVGFLKEYMSAKNIETKIVPFTKIYDNKISTSALKKLVSDGNVSALNACLSQPYFMLGTVIHARHRGRILGYPTANLSVREDTLKLGGGIYATKMYFDEKSYYGVTNVGSKPTFGESDYSVETYLFDFTGDIYGKAVRLEFYKKIRGVLKFSSIPALIRQLEQDENKSREYFNLPLIQH